MDQAKQLKELKKENAQLKLMLADEMLGKELSKEGLEKKAVSPGHKRQIAEEFVSVGALHRTGCVAARSPIRRSSRTPGCRS